MSAKTESGRGSHKKLVIAFTIFIIVLAAIAGGRGIYKAINPEKATPPAKISVKTAEASTGTVTVTAVYTGKATAENEVNVVPKLPGKVQSVSVSLGDKVNKGDVLFTLDPADVSSQANQARISAAAAKKARDKASSAIKDAKKAESDAKATLKKLEEQAKNPLIPEQTITINAMDAAKAAIAQATQAKASAESAYDQADTQYKLAVENVNAADNAIANCTVYSPLTGSITSLNIQAGGMAGQTMPAVTVSDVSRINITVGVSENLVSVLKQGDAVSVSLRSVSDEVLAGRITSIVPSPPQGQTTYPVIITLDKESPTLKPGMFAEVTITTARAENVIVVPSDAIMIKADTETVAVLDSDNKVQMVAVTTGLDDGKNTEIKSGVKAGDFVIYEGQYYVDEDSEVKVVK